MSGGRHKKRCFYEVLGVEPTATDDEIRKSYRILVLKWHPDKNSDNKEKATEEFRAIQEAYECLTDPKERAWYDKHKDSILRGHGKEDVVDDGFDVFPYFSSGCYSGFDDSENGFYTVYRQVFESIVKDDLPYRGDDDEVPPGFGTSSSPYSDVHTFYAYWQSYCTPKTFSWLDDYDLNAAPNRRYARAMEKENKKRRDAGKKKRNEEIRELVAFVKKRDKRLLKQKKINEELVNEKRKKSKANQLKQIQERQKELEAYKESEWAAMSTLEDELKEIEENLVEHKKRGKSKRKKDKNVAKPVNELNEGESNALQESSGEVESDPEEHENVDLDEMNLYCIACDKTFKSVKAFANHENSKKHRNNLAFLKDELATDDILLNSVSTAS